jgi:Xaa-Pro dipeptidase
MNEPGYLFADPKFSAEEYQQRLDRVRKEMKRDDVEVLVLFSPRNFYYLTGYDSGATYYQSLIITPSEMILFLREMEQVIGRVTTGSGNITIWQDHLDPTNALVSFLKQKGWFDQRIGVEMTSPSLSARDYLKLAKALGRAPLDGTACVDRVRLIKSDREIHYIRKASEFTTVGVQAAMESLAEGKSENEVAADLYSAMVKAGSEALPSGPTVSSGPMSGVAHAMFHRYVLKRGDAVLFEFSGVYNSYPCPIMRCAAILEASSRLRKMADACKGGLEAAIEATRAGVTSGSVDEACRLYIERAGFEPMFRKRTGYSVGIYKPRWSEPDVIDIKRDDPRILEEGMVFHMPPALRDPERCGVGFSETVRVTKTGCEILTNAPRKLVITSR